MSQRPIADYAMLSDCHTAALVGRDGSIDWLCLPRFDRPSLFGRMLDEELGGHWWIRPSAPWKVSRRYVDRTLVLETTFRTPGGVLRIQDALAMEWGVRGHAHGIHSPRLLLRRVFCDSGEVEVDFDYTPRPEYGRVHPLLRSTEGGIWTRGGADVVQLSSPVALEVRDGQASGTLRLASGQRLCFALHHRMSWEEPPGNFSQEEIESRLDDTIEGWQAWAADHQSYEGPFQEAVHHGGRVLHGLTYAPTGAIVAAPTTSLPETLGGTRNWDYRFTWLRDASLTLDALWVAACPDEADRFFGFVAGAAFSELRHQQDLPIMYGVGGEHDLSERVLEHLAGWRDSRPVRIGNEAWRQRQLDVYGQLLDAAWTLREQIRDLDPVTRAFLLEMADVAAERWELPDHGIWEIRDEPRHYVHSKLMCWVALDRAIRLAGLLHAEDRVGPWSEARERIARAILARGYNERVGAFTQTFEGDALDASTLLVPLVGFLPASDPRVRSTLRAIEGGLTDRHGLVYRYKADDGLPGEEGAFLLCSFWLAQAQALTGEREKGMATCAMAASFANDVGLLSEQVDPETGESLGNFPQAFSHIGLVNAAWDLSISGAGPG